MFCSKCGAEIPANSEFCLKCGSKINNFPVQVVPIAAKKHRFLLLREKVKNNTVASISTLLISLVVCLISLNIIAKNIGNIYVDNLVLNSQKSIVALEQSAPILAGSLSSDMQKQTDMQNKFIFTVFLLVVLSILSILALIVFIRMIKFYINKKRNNQIVKDKFALLSIFIIIILGIGLYFTINNTASAVGLIKDEISISNESNNDSSSSESNDNLSTVSAPSPEVIVDSNGKKIWKVYYTQPYLHFTETYTGTGNFIIDILDSNQDLYGNVVNEIGDYQLDKTVKVPSGEGFYYVEQQISHGSTTGDFYPSAF